LGIASYRRLRLGARVLVGRSLTPSFARHTEEEIRILLLLAKRTGIDPFALWPFMSKGRGVREVVESLSLAAPRVLHGPMPSSDVPWEDLPASFVVKPSTGSSSRGVFVMRRADDGRFDDLMHGQRWTAEDLVRQYQHRPSSWHDVLKDEVFVEELVECRGRPSYDWKVYAFQGEVTLFDQLDRIGGSMRIRCYLPDWTPELHVWHGRYDHDDPLDPPTRPDELMRAASAISRAIPLPFVRVDLYESDTEVLVGELTPFPGSRHEHSARWDRILGEAWERGEAALRASGVPRYNLPPRVVDLRGGRVGL